MRLAVGVAKLEAAARVARRAVPLGICWTAHDVRVDAASLAPGEYIAADVVVVCSIDGTLELRISERVTADPSDLGVVRDTAGVTVGRVVSIDGSLLGLELEPGYVPPLAPDDPGDGPPAAA